MQEPSINRVLTFGAAGTLTPPAPQVVQTGGFAAPVKARKTKQGGAILEGMRIFKKGTFKDSLGIEQTWEDAHLQQMIFHFTLLRDGGVFPNVPVRVDHSFSARNVVGYFQDVYLAEDDPSFLAANIEITEPDAYEKWERGTYRSRSLEVGFYETNDGAQYFPVIMGLAFVDIPAVEGLYGRTRPLAFSAVTGIEEETTVPDAPTPTPATPPAAPGTEPGETAPGQPAPPANTAVPAAPAAPTPQATAPAPQVAPAAPAQHSAPGQPHTFTIAGQQTSDFGAVQRHIAALEQFQAETVDTVRTDFVNGLAAGPTPRIAATQVEEFTKLVRSMTPEQFASFKTLYSTPAPPVGQIAGAPGAPTPLPTPAGTSALEELTFGRTVLNAEEQIEVDLEVVGQHRRSGLDEDKIKKTQSYQRLVAAGKLPA
jgi:hypothetical protein